jgi:hypothetical protein
VADDRLERPSRDDFRAPVSRYIERNPHASCCEIAKDLFVPITIISQALEEIESRFFIVRWMPHERSVESKENRVDICQKMLEILEKFGLRQTNYVVTGDEC